ncbi:MAG TPA: hypothetical protein VGB07_09645, partial [Blastocatellia bacterium]
MKNTGHRFHRFPFTLLALLCACAVVTAFKSGAWLTYGRAQTQTVVSVESKSLTRTQSDEVKIRLAALGTENAIGFSLLFDPQQLTFIKAELASDAKSSDGQTAAANFNLNQIASGRIGVTLALASGKTFPRNELVIVKAVFVARNDAIAATTLLGFGNQPVVQEVVDAFANTLPATFTPGTITIQGTDPTPTPTPEPTPTPT